VPTVSTKAEATRSSDGRLDLVRRRIHEGFYDRLEVRRTIATLVLKELARPTRPAGSSRPETA
jgi:hypothetical protein